MAKSSKTGAGSKARITANVSTLAIRPPTALLARADDAFALQELSLHPPGLFSFADRLMEKMQKRLLAGASA